MAKEKEKQLLAAKESFTFQYQGGPRSVAAGDLYWSDDPALKGLEHMFAPAKSLHERTWETASAAPGEERDVSHPEPEAKPTEAKPAAAEKPEAKAK